jgi:hypothetical protein
VIGGTASVIGGGKFENGAITGAFGYLFNDVVVRLHPEGANGFGHVGTGINTENTEGYYPAEPYSGAKMITGRDLPGEVDLDSDHYKGSGDTVIIKTTPEQDQKMQQFIDATKANPGNYNLYSHNCVDFCRAVLNAGGVKTPDGMIPNNWFPTLRKQQLQ